MRFVTSQQRVVLGGDRDPASHPAPGGVPGVCGPASRVAAHDKFNGPIGPDRPKTGFEFELYFLDRSFVGRAPKRTFQSLGTTANSTRRLRREAGSALGGDGSRIELRCWVASAPHLVRDSICVSSLSAAGGSYLPSDGALKVALAMSCI